MKRLLLYPIAALVLGLMIVSAARLAVGRQSLSCQLEAWANMMPRVVIPNVPDTLRFKGTVHFPRRGIRSN